MVLLDVQTAGLMSLMASGLWAHHESGWLGTSHAAARQMIVGFINGIQHLARGPISAGHYNHYNIWPGVDPLASAMHSMLDEQRLCQASPDGELASQHSYRRRAV
ncbi:hypothetical protein Tdes44962_MAKER02311 [Teratosphaeria destructans]|uniref:Uncharacterized protein n=1 Tax=Teratosphaeria destructans TaxID=418781 RepID=A0A9W7SUK3_9PEZI|nr:hypothetical protein Tdes44962_MAKER02311 [Teratosphaeria destructans]